MAIGSYDREELNELLEGRQFRKLRETMSEMNEVDIAEFIEELEAEKKVLVYRMLPKELAADVFSFLEVDDQEHIINSITDYELGKIVEDLYVDDAVDMLEELPAIVVKRVLQNATPETRNLINQFLQYPENSAGSIMTAEYIGLKRNMTVEQAFAYIRENGVDKETIYTCYVINRSRVLVGVLSLREILLAVGEDPDRPGLVETPRRVADMYAEVFAGLETDPRQHLKFFEEKSTDEMVIVRDIPFASMCEHHLLPFVGKAHIAYIPADNRIIGLSKFARIVDCFARRPQVQERLTQQIADALVEYAGARGVIVVTECEHLCMSMRGIKKSSARTVTSAVRGLLRNPATRAEAMSLILDK